MRRTGLQRRAFGSYYTPDHIVRYIIGQTLDPICNQLTRDVAADVAAARDAGAPAEVIEQREAEFPDRILRLRVLDPSMGSGHFLIAACQYLAEQIATNPYTPPGPDTGADDTLAFWKRAVVENCLYGVDLNPLAVELARLAMWLETVSRDRPLTFLDHHLKHGNSLIGARLTDLPALAGTGDLIGAALAPAFRRRLPALIEPLAEIRNTPSDTLGTVKQKEKSYTAYLRAVEPFRRLADLWTADAAGRRVDPGLYADAADNADKPVKFREVIAREAAADPLAFAAKIRAFHWDLAFPEVFCGPDGAAPGAGFDAVIGNPPYEVLSELESGIDPTDLKTFVGAVAAYRPAVRGKHNLYKLFIARALEVLRDGGRLGFIVPMPLLGDDQAAGLRKHMAAAGGFTAVDAFPQKDDAARRVFADAKLSTVVFAYHKDPAAAAARFPCRFHRADVVEENAAGELHPTTADLAEYDPENLTIVSCDAADWEITVRIMKSGRMVRLSHYCTSFQGEVNETNERDTCLSKTPGFGPLVLRGANVCLYQVRDASQGEPVFISPERFLNGKQPGAKAWYSQEQRIGFQRSAPQNNFRRLIAAPLAPQSYCFDTVSFIPQSRTALDLRVILGLLNSVLLDWYFRLGSTNSKVNEYQFNNLPCPRFRDAVRSGEEATGRAAVAALDAGQPAVAELAVEPLLADAPFSPALQPVIAAAVDRVVAAESARGSIARSDRSALSPAAQPYQDFLDHVFFRLAGLTPAEVAGLRTRYEAMRKLK